MLDSIEDYEWKEKTETAYEKTLYNMNNDLLYIQDNWANQQTRLEDLEEDADDRYEVKISWNYNAPDHPDTVIDTATTWNEAEQILESETQ